MKGKLKVVALPIRGLDSRFRRPPVTPLRKIGAREMLLALDVNRPVGHLLLLEYLKALSDGKIPLADVTLQLANAFESIVFDSADPLLALQLKRRRGERKPESSAELSEREGPVCAFIWQKLEADDHRRGALTRALDAAEDLGFRGRTGSKLKRRQIESIWARNRDLYQAHRYARRMQELWDRYITPAEFERMKDGPATEIDRLALRRHRQATKKPQSK